MSGPRQEMPCGCVADTLDGERVWVVECTVHKLTGLVFAHVEVEPLSWTLDEEGVHGPFAVDGSPR